MSLTIDFLKNFQYFQGLKVLDNSVENLASGAWQALGSAWRGGSDFVHKYVPFKLDVFIIILLLNSCI